jgi:hypothetical protein
VLSEARRYRLGEAGAVVPTVRMLDACHQPGETREQPGRALRAVLLVVPSPGAVASSNEPAALLVVLSDEMGRR